jgi:metallo-beta-lactamase class B
MGYGAVVLIMRTLALVLALLPLGVQSNLRPDPDTVCGSCDAWNRPIEPFQFFGNTYYVGTAGLSALLITSDSGHILLDGGLTQSAAVIDRNIRALGFRTEDVRYILASHEHYDHVGGIAALQRLSGATVLMSAPGVRALAAGGPLSEDPQFGMGVKENAYPPVAQTRPVSDREVVTLGPLAVTAHLTPGHTPGGTSWTWRSCERDRCLAVVYADSLTPVSADGFRFTGGAGRPDITPIFRATIDRIEQLPCDIVVSTHPGATGLSQKLTQRDSGQGAEAFVDPNSCRAYAAMARTNLERRIAQEHKLDPRLRVLIDGKTVEGFVRGRNLGNGQECNGDATLALVREPVLDLLQPAID